MPTGEQHTPSQQEIRQEFAKHLKRMTPLDKFMAIEGYKIGIKFAEQQAAEATRAERHAAEIMSPSITP